MFGELGVFDDDGHSVRCHCCGRRYRTLCAHLARAHGLSTSDYRAIFGLNRSQALAAWDYRGRLSVANLERDSFASLRGRIRLPSRERLQQIGALPSRLQRRKEAFHGPAPPLPPGVIGAMPTSAEELRCSVCAESFVLLRAVARRRRTSHDIVCGDECYAELQRRRLQRQPMLGPAHRLLSPESREKMVATARARAARITHCPRGHPYDETSWIPSRPHQRRCRQCQRDKKAAERRAAGCAVVHRFPDDEVRDIRAAYAAGGVTMAALARQHGVTTMSIAQILWRHTYRSVI